VKKFTLFITLLLIFSCKKVPEKEVKKIRNIFEMELSSINGENFSLVDFKGKTILLNFFTTWCSYCKKEIPELKRIHNELKNENFILIGIDIGENFEKVKRFIKKHGINYLILLDRSSNFSSYFNIRGIPTNIILDKNLKIIFRSHGLPRIEDIRKVL